MSTNSGNFREFMVIFIIMEMYNKFIYYQNFFEIEKILQKFTKLSKFPHLRKFKVFQNF